MVRFDTALDYPGTKVAKRRQNAEVERRGYERSLQRSPQLRRRSQAFILPDLNVEVTILIDVTL
ncbi:MAG TPA: hypothetical protein VLA88_02255 [Candidatus Saccharimonadales bacterium]|nr:hypothetical protein [Candidatus Saccharimonadales bacterium]